MSVSRPAKTFQPTRAPTTACDVETGTPYRDMTSTVAPAARATTNAPATRSTAPSAPSVWLAPDPAITAPRTTATPLTSAAVRKLTIREPTAVPKMLAPSLAPSDQPSRRPLDRNRIGMAHTPRLMA